MRKIVMKLIPSAFKPTSLKFQILVYRFFAKRNLRRDLWNWKKRNYGMPAPTLVKWEVLKRYGFHNPNWIETGTFMGDTTKYLSKNAKKVYSIEPQPNFAENAKKRFKKNENITIINGTSEDELPKLLDLIEGNLSIWLDGHFSAGDTFKGTQDTPIRDELNELQKRMEKFLKIAVFVDDVRCFDPMNPEFSTYPDKNWLVNWANDNNLEWTIEHDIFVAYKS